MDLYMCEVAFAATEDDVKVELARILHRPPFPLDPPLNFELYFFKRQRNSRGKAGIVNLPTRESGATFLRSYGTTGVIVKGRSIKFTISNRPVDRARVQVLNATSWRDPQELQAERERRIREGKPYSLNSYAFGRFLPDGSFSSECTMEGAADIACDFERRQVRFTLRQQRQRSHPDDDMASMMNMIFRSESSITASYPPSMIDSILDSRTTHRPTIFLRANAFPIFATEVSGMFDDRTVSKRSQGLMLGTPMPAGCFSLACTFTEEDDRDTFVQACRTRFHISHSSRSADIPIHENLSTLPTIRTLDSFLSDLPFEFAFEIEKAITNWTLSPSDVLSLKDKLVSLRATHGDASTPIFRRFVSLWEEEGPNRKSRRRWRSRGHNRPTLATLADHLTHAVDLYLQEQQQPRGKLAPSSASTAVSYSFHMILTPTRYILEGPVTDQSNSVLRRFGHHECFLRVSFQDENRSKLRRDLEMSITELLAERYRPILINGYVLAGRRYQLLGYSMSGLKEHSLWFVTPFQDDEGRMLDAPTIRESLGDFTRLQYQPARLGARWSQAFSATDPSITIQLDEIQRIEDIKSPSGTVMTDGCSPISPTLARDIWKANQRTKRRPARGKAPSAFQFRLGGAKGMVVQDPTLEGRVVCLRDSQIKFEAPNNRTFDIQSTSMRPKAMFLNRPLIVVMEHLGVSSERVIELQDRSINEAQSVRASFRDASKVLQQHGLGTSFHLPSLFRNLSSILDLNIGSETGDEENFYSHLVVSSLRCAETHILRELKYRAHIAVPGSFTLLGVSDEWDCLHEGEIYATVRDDKRGLYKEITGKVAITRSPQIHPGDVQVVTAVRRPELEHLTNVVVFSCRGNRPLASCLGGGDLDGDDFNLILDPELLPQYTATPGAYTPLPIKVTPRPCGIEDVVDFIFDYIEADLVGQIAISHLRFSDLNGPDCAECLKLAEFASHAVDFPKTGTPVKFQDLPRTRERTRPDFLAREGADLGSDRYYNSQKLLGMLFRRVPVRNWIPDEWNDVHSPSGGEVVEQALERAGLYGLGLSLANPSDELHDEMHWLLDEYCRQLSAIGTTHTISKNKDMYVSEAELVSGTIMANWSDHHRRREAVAAMNVQTQELVRAVRAEIRASDANVREEDEDEFSDDGEWEDEDDFYRESRLIAETFNRAWAAWCVAEEALQEYPASYGPQSFGLIALGQMLELIKAAKQLL